MDQATLPIEQYIEQAVQEVFPDQVVDTGEVVPLIDSSLGHIGATVCQCLARDLKLSPQKISQVLLPALMKSLSSDVVFDEGYLNFSFKGTEWRMLRSNVCPASPENRQRIFLTAFVDTLTDIEYVRLAALASMQALQSLAVGTYSEIHSAGIVYQIESLANVISFFKVVLKRVQAVDEEACSTDEAAREVVGCLQATQLNTTVWLAPRSLARKKYSELFKKYASPSTTFCCPSRSYLAGNGRVQLGVLSEAPTLNAIVYLCSAIRSSDIDLFVPSAREVSNTVWFARTLLERSRSVGLEPAAETVFDWNVPLEELSQDDRELLILTAQQRRMQCRAASAGRVVEWHEAFHLLLGFLSRRLNSPESRVKLEENNISTIERKILTGVLKSVSDIMLLWDSESEG